MRKVKSLVLQTLFGTVLLIIWLKLTNLSELLSYFSKINPYFIFLALTFGTLGSLIRIFRWKLVLRPLVEVPFKKLLLYGYLQAFINYLIPLRVGELTTTVLIKKEYKLPFSTVFATTILNRLFDILAILLISTISFLILSSGNQKFLGLFYFSALALLGSTGFIIFFSYPRNSQLPIVRTLKKFLNARFKKLLKDFSVGMQILSRDKFLTLNLFLTSSLALFVDGLSFYFIFLGFHINVFLPLVLLSVIIFTLTFLIPAAPAYIGSAEIAGYFLFTFLLGVNKTQASSVTVFWHLLNSISLVSFGLFSIWILKRRGVI